MNSAQCTALAIISYYCSSLAGVPFTKQLARLFQTDGILLDSLTFVPWHRGRSLCWAFTVIYTLAESHMNGTDYEACEVVNVVASCKEEKCRCR